MLVSAKPEAVERFLKNLPDEIVLALPWLWEFWAMEHQLPPGDRDWRTWVILGGRGAGKTRAGAEWVRAQVEGSRPDDPGRAKRVALIGETIEQTREVMVFGESGILACSPPDRCPRWEATRKRLVWPNGAVAQVFSAHEPEALRGPQFDAAWLDEVAKWKKAEAAWDMLQFALRLGDNPQQVITTTPRNVKLLRDILADDSTCATSAPTSANRANLADSFLEEVERRYGGTRLGRQELEGVLLSDAEGALWTSERIEGLRCDLAGELDRIIVAVDPPVTGGPDADLCGIVVAGAKTEGPPQNWRAVVLEDASLKGSPSEWIRRVIEVQERWQADRVVAETNQGGELIETLLRQFDAMVPYRAVHAARAKAARAEPVAALYEQGRVRHMRGLGALEDQMCQITRTGFQGRGSPDRVDALVWALFDLMIEPARKWSAPRMRVL